jgi:4'-phosphopantetheinyl transferase
MKPERLSALSQLLSAEERCRASRFHFARDCRRFTVARALLRFILGQRLELPPARLTFAYSAFGKPFLQDTQLRFNVSHSADLAVFAVAEGGEVGVDVELVRPQPEMHRIAERIFLAHELAQLQSRRADAQTELFFRLWTQNEARLKARGVGFGAELTRHPAAGAWPVRAIDPEAGYVGAIAMEAGEFEIALQRLP